MNAWQIYLTIIMLAASAWVIESLLSKMGSRLWRIQGLLEDVLAELKKKK